MTTRTEHINAYDKAKPKAVFPRASGTFTAKAPTPLICISKRILCTTSSVPNLLAKEMVPLQVHQTGIKSKKNSKKPNNDKCSLSSEPIEK